MRAGRGQHRRRDGKNEFVVMWRAALRCIMNVDAVFVDVDLGCGHQVDVLLLLLLCGVIGVLINVLMMSKCCCLLGNVTWTDTYQSVKMRHSTMVESGALAHCVMVTVCGHRGHGHRGCA